jgi:hypothetical protein
MELYHQLETTRPGAVVHEKVLSSAADARGRALVPTVNPKPLSIACESVDNRAMGDLLKLDWYAVAGLFRSRAALQTEVLALRHRLNVLKRRAPKRVAVNIIDRLVFTGLYHLAPEVLDAVKRKPPKEKARDH